MDRHGTTSTRATTVTRVVMVTRMALSGTATTRMGTVATEMAVIRTVVGTYTTENGGNLEGCNLNRDVNGHDESDDGLDGDTL